MSDNARRWWPWHRRTIKYLSVAVIAAAVSVPLATLSSAASVAAGSPIPASAASRLSSLLLQEAGIGGDASPVSLTAVMTTHDKALEAATPGDTTPGSVGETVYLAVMKGNFTLGNVSVPPGGHAPTGQYLAITVDTTTFQILDLGLSDNPPSVALQSLGAVSNLMPQE
jgi:hypothetical protein